MKICCALEKFIRLADWNYLLKAATFILASSYPKLEPTVKLLLPMAMATEMSTLRQTFSKVAGDSSGIVAKRKAALEILMKLAKATVGEDFDFQYLNGTSCMYFRSTIMP